MNAPMDVTMRTTLSLALMVVLACTCAGVEPVRLVCIGDSITQGSDHAAGGKATQSWRYPLWKHCLEAGIDIAFFGRATLRS